MKILHTSDLHIGHNFFGFDRFEEYEEFFEWLRNLIKKERIELLIISGDIFDIYFPSTKAQKQYFDFLNSIDIKTIIIGGNHDSPSTLEAPRKILENLDIEIISGSEENYKKLIEFDDFKILAVSYLREGILNKIDSDYVKAFEKIYTPQKRTIALGHLSIGGSKLSGSERELYIGKIEAVPSSIFEGFEYVALGHIHKPQVIKNKIIYSGSPLQMSFDEDYQKKVVIINTDDFSYKFVDVPRFREFVKLKGSFEEIKERIKNLKPKSFVEIELNEVVDNILIEELRRDDLNIVKIKFPFVEITKESVDIEKISPKNLVESIFEDDEEKNEILKLFDEIRSEIED